MDDLFKNTFIEEENIEYISKPERSEFVGNRQKSLDTQPEQVADKEVHPKELENNNEQDNSNQKLISFISDNLIKTNIPGLTQENIINTIIQQDVAIQESLKPYNNIINDPNSTDEEKEQAEEDKEKQKQVLINSLSSTVAPEIINIKIRFQKIQNATKTLPTVITNFITNMAVPKVVVAGSATGVSNPITAALEASQFKAQLSDTLNGLAEDALSLLQSAEKISFPVPEIVKSVIQSIASLAVVINNIPG